MRRDRLPIDGSINRGRFTLRAVRGALPSPPCPHKKSRSQPRQHKKSRGRLARDGCPRCPSCTESTRRGSSSANPPFRIFERSRRIRPIFEAQPNARVVPTRSSGAAWVSGSRDGFVGPWLKVVPTRPRGGRVPHTRNNLSTIFQPYFNDSHHSVTTSITY